MEHRKKSLLFNICLGVVLLALPLIAGAQPTTAQTSTTSPSKKYKPVKAIWQANEVPGDRADKRWGELRKRWTEATDGLLTFEMHYQYELYKINEAIEAVSTGALHFTNGWPTTTFSWDPRVDIYNLPMIFSDFAHMKRFHATDAMKKFVAELEAKGTRIVPGSLDGNPSSTPIYTTFPIKSYKDLAGHNMRVQPGPTYAKMVELLGVKGKTVSTSELPVALQTGMIDCMHGANAKGWVKALGIGDHMKYWIQPDLCMSAYWYFCSTKWFRSLPKEWQEKMDKVSLEWASWAWKDNRDEYINDSVAFILQSMKRIDLPAQDVAELRKLLEPVYGEYTKLHPNAQELLDAVNKSR